VSEAPNGSKHSVSVLNSSSKNGGSLLSSSSNNNSTNNSSGNNNNNHHHHNDIEDASDVEHLASLHTRLHTSIFESRDELDALKHDLNIVAHELRRVNAER